MKLKKIEWKQYEQSYSCNGIIGDKLLFRIDWFYFPKKPWTLSTRLPMKVKDKYKHFATVEEAYETADVILSVFVESLIEGELE